MDHIKGQFRQGDVLLNPISGVPADAKPVAEDSIILAYGEATGHAHLLKGRAVLLEHEGRRFLVVDGVHALLDHEEHGIMEVQPDIYEIVFQKKTDLSGQWQRVTD